MSMGGLRIYEEIYDVVASLETAPNQCADAGSGETAQTSPRRYVSNAVAVDGDTC